MITRPFSRAYVSTVSRGGAARSLARWSEDAASPGRLHDEDIAPLGSDDRIYAFRALAGRDAQRAADV